MFAPLEGRTAVVTAAGQGIGWEAIAGDLCEMAFAAMRSALAQLKLLQWTIASRHRMTFKLPATSLLRVNPWEDSERRKKSPMQLYI